MNESEEKGGFLIFPHLMGLFCSVIHLPYQVSISYGSVVTTPKFGDKLSDVIQEADGIMYAAKREKKKFI